MSMTGRLAALAVPLLLATALTASANQRELLPSEVVKQTRPKPSTGPQYGRIPHQPFTAESLGGGDRTHAPYFQVASSDGAGEGEGERLPLKATSAEIDIAGVIARVKVKQRFENHGKKPIEAVYVFPASTRAAVHAMRMRIGERTVEARIDRKAAARQAYEDARAAGQRASLLEQERPNVFTTRVANVMPKDVIEVELEYSELLIPENGTYELVYPTVVGPRYAGGSNPAKDGWIGNPYLGEGQPAPYTFDVKVRVHTGIALKELSSPSHPVDVSYEGSHRASVALKPGENGGNRDFVLRYRLAGEQIETGVLLWQEPGADGGFFTLMMEPPARVAEDQIPPREYIFLLDVSGSMHGFPLDTAKELMRKLFSQLRPTDSFNVSLFSGGAYVLSPEGSLPATPANVTRALEAVLQQRGGGGTELLGGLRASYAIPKREPGVSRTVVVVTDGYVGVEAEAFRFIRERLDEANLFAFGIGSSVNRFLIEGMARAGQGQPFVVLDGTKAQAEADKLQRYIQRPALSDVQLRFHGFDVYEVAPAKVPDLLSLRPLVVYGKFRGAAKGRIEVKGRTGQGRFSRSIEVSPAQASPHASALKSLWARKWVELLSDEHTLQPAKELEDAITELGLAYHLLTDFTSFVAIDSEVVNRSGKSSPVHQPLPLPQGVSNLALEERAPAPEALGALPPMRPKAPKGKRHSALDSVASAAPQKPAGMGAAREAEQDEDAKVWAPKVRALVSTQPRSSLATLIRRVEQEVAKQGRCTAEGKLELELLLDAQGRITSLRVLSRGPACHEPLKKALVGQRFAGLRSETLRLTLE